MSSRPFLIDRAEETLRLFTAEDPVRNVAIAVVNKLLPQILRPEQLIGVPEASILIGQERSEHLTFWTLYSLHGGALFEDSATNRGTRRDPAKVLARGPLTVIFMP